jgi:hypothetical protein
MAGTLPPVPFLSVVAKLFQDEEAETDSQVQGEGVKGEADETGAQAQGEGVKEHQEAADFSWGAEIHEIGVYSLSENEVYTL